MTKGCFVKFIIILTIVVAAGLYIVQNKFNNIFIGPGKKIIKNALNDSWGKELAFVKDTPQKDSVKILIENYIDKIKNVNDISDKEFDHIKFVIENAVEDSIIDQEDLENLKNILRAKK